MADDPFVFTDRMVTISNQLWEVTSIVGAGLCFFVLLIISIVRLHPVSRPHLDRVSFRILMYALLTNTVFGIVNAIGGSFTGPTWACGFSIFILQLTLELSSFLILSIALNLQLVVVHHVNGQRMEKYYILGSLAISLCITIPPYASKQYGWDPLVQDCWYANDNQKERLAWQIGTQLFWSMLTVVGEVCTSLTVIIYMLRHQILQKRAVRSRSHFNSSRTRSRSNSTTSQNQQVVYANAYRNVLIRIGLYPLASCIINITSVACVIHATKTDGIKSISGYRVLLLSDFVYGGRAVVYALLAATDPALVRALKSLTWHIRGKKTPYPVKCDTIGQMNLTLGSQTGEPIPLQIKLTTVYCGNGDALNPTSFSTNAQREGPHKSVDTLPTCQQQREFGVSVGPAAPGSFKDGERMSQSDLEGDSQVRHILEKRQLEALAREQEREAFKKQI